MKTGIYDRIRIRQGERGLRFRGGDLAGVLRPGRHWVRGRIFGAEEALGKGLISRVVPDDDLEEEALATARRIAAGAPLAARWHKKFIRRAGDPTPFTEAEEREPYESCDTADYREGVRAFLAKEKPVFRGK